MPQIYGGWTLQERTRYSRPPESQSIRQFPRITYKMPLQGRYKRG